MADKKTKFSGIPVSWANKKLEEVAVFQNGKAHENLVDENGRYILINSKFISTEGKVAKFVSDRVLPLFINDIAIVMSDLPNGRALGKCYLIEKDDTFTLNQRIGLIRSEQINSKFLFYQLNRNSYFLKFDDGVGQTNLKKGDILECPIAVPPIEEQQKIVEILSSVDTQIEQTEQLIEKTKELKKGLMQHLLTKGIGHTEFKQSELGNIPVSWSCEKLDEVAERVTVGIATSSTNHYVSYGVTMIRNQNIKEQYVDLTDVLYIDEEFDNANKNKRLKEGDLVTVRTGYPGQTAVVPKELENAQSFTTLITTPRKEFVNSHYLSYLINSPIGMNQLDNMAAGGAQKNINAASLKQLKVTLPPLQEQQKIAEILATVDTEIDSYEQEKAKYEELKKGLMQQLLTGKIRVKVDA